ncbi:hypothetical protein pipiens_000371, partial [Culex pipiens pipiens]
VVKGEELLCRRRRRYSKIHPR